MPLKTYSIIALLAAWLTAISFFYANLMAFDARPGSAARALAQCPQNPALHLHHSKQNLILFLHPKCSCSRASLELLAKLQRDFPQTIHTILVVWKPAGADASWGKLPLPDDSSRRAHDEELVWDAGGKLAAIFDAHTSGQAFLYDSRGSLRFSGGITSARADSQVGPAYQSLTAAIQGGASERKPVFGCSF